MFRARVFFFQGQSYLSNLLHSGKFVTDFRARLGYFLFIDQRWGIWLTGPFLDNRKKTPSAKQSA
jgi:hypothetical protein